MFSPKRSARLSADALRQRHPRNHQEGEGEKDANAGPQPGLGVAVGGMEKCRRSAQIILNLQGEFRSGMFKSRRIRVAGLPAAA